MRHTQRRYTISRLQKKEEEEKQQTHHNSSPPPVCSRQIFGVVDKKDIRKALKSLGIFSSSLLLLQTWDPRKREIKKGKTTNNKGVTKKKFSHLLFAQMHDDKEEKKSFFEIYVSFLLLLVFLSRFFFVVHKGSPPPPSFPRGFRDCDGPLTGWRLYFSNSNPISRPPFPPFPPRSPPIFRFVTIFPSPANERSIAAVIFFPGFTLDIFSFPLPKTLPLV